MNQSGEDLETESDLAPDILLAKVNNLLKIIGIPLEKQLKQIDELKSVRLLSDASITSTLKPFDFYKGCF